jgi:hypothetical protein
MVLVCERCAEQREDAVAGRLHDIAVVVTHCLDHEMQCGIDDRAGFFGIEVLHQLGRTLDVRKQRGDRLALALDCFKGRAIGGDYDLRFRRRGECRGGGFCGANCIPAFLAKSRTWTNRCFARWANQLQLRSAPLAERGVTGVVLVAGRTAHRNSCGAATTLRGRSKEDGARWLLHTYFVSAG